MKRFGAAFLWHFRRERVRMLVLGICAAVFVALMIALSDSVRPADIQELMDKLPPALLSMVGMDEGEMFDVARWVGLIHAHPVWVVAILGFPLAAGLRGVAGGVDDGSLEVVLAQPISRSTYYMALVAVIALGVTVVLTFSMLGSLIGRSVIEDPSSLATGTLVQLSTSGWALAVSVAGIALLASVTGAGGGRPGTTAIGAVVGMFFLRFIADMVPDLSWLRWLSVFGYHDANTVVKEGLTLFPVGVLLSVGAACALAGLAAFRRKQLTF